MLRTRILTYKIKLASLLGKEVDTMSKKFRLSFFADHVRIWELSDAGKRGKKVTMLVVTSGFVGAEIEPEDRESILKAAEDASGTNDLLNALEDGGYRVDMRSVPANKVVPSSGVPISLTTKGFSIWASPFKFEITTPPGVHSRGPGKDPIIVDQPSVSSRSPRDAAKFYDWVLSNFMEIHEMSRQVLFASMRLQGINYV
jgi:hypothetical protein